MEPEEANVKGKDIPIVNLIPIRKRKTNPKLFKKLKSSIEYLGRLIDPICVCHNKGEYYILDGYQRYTVLMEMGVETVPCLILDSMDLYTPNRHVNNVSPVQEQRMLKKALEVIPEKKIAQAFGILSVTNKLSLLILNQLHKDVVKYYDKGIITKGRAHDLTFVSKERQKEILDLMKEMDDFSSEFIRSQILKTPPSQRSKTKKVNTPWNKKKRNRSILIKKLVNAEKKHDYYTMVFQQYKIDFIKISIYIRNLINDPSMGAYIQDQFPKEVLLFRKILKNDGDDL